MDDEVLQFLNRHLNAILENNLEIYHETTHPELGLYEWYVTPHRLDGLPFHDFLMTVQKNQHAAAGGPTGANRLDLSNLRIQRYADTAIASYTLLISRGETGGVTVTAHNESRVMVKLDGRWQVVHVHKSPAWPAPHIQP